MPLKRSLLQEDISLTTTAQYGAALTHVTLQAAITAIGSTRTVLSLMPGTWSIGANVTFPPNITPYIRAGAIVNINTGVTLSVYEYRADLSDWQAGGGTFTHLRYTDMATYVGWKQPAAVGAVNRSLADHTSEYLSGRDFGMAPTNTNNSAAFQAAVTAASSLGKVLKIPAGTYPFATTLTIAAHNVHIIGEGVVILQHTGAGAGLSVSGESLSPQRLYNCHLENLTLQGNAATTQAFSWRDVYRSTGVRLKARDCDSAFYLAGCHSCNFEDLSSSGSEAAFGTKVPTLGLLLTDSVANSYTQTCTFNDLLFEGLTTGLGIGIYVERGWGNLFTGGMIRACANGIVVEGTTNNQNNTFDGFALQENSGTAINVAGRMTRFVNCSIRSPGPVSVDAVIVNGSQNHFEGCTSWLPTHIKIISGLGNTFSKCYIASIICTTGCQLPSFYDCSFESTFILGFQTAVAVRMRNCWRVDGSFAWVSTYADA